MKPTNNDDQFSKLTNKISQLLEKYDQIQIDKLDIFLPNLVAEIQSQMIPTQPQVPFRWQTAALPSPPQVRTTAIETILFERSNGNKVYVGGEQFYPYEKGPNEQVNPHRPKVAFDVFDMKIKLPKVIKKHYKEVLTDPAGWAELAEKLGADLITLHFVSTDPGINDTSVSKSAAILEEVLQRVKIPIIIGGSGNKKKDTELFEELAAITADERLMLSSADKLTWDKVVPIARKYDHNVLLWAQLDINDQTKLVEDALNMGMPRDHIILDPTCATLGYGLEYSYSIYQRIRQAGLQGNTTLNFPMSGGTTNAWGAREAWMKKIAHMTNFGGDRELRGPIWEIITALTMSIVGLDLAMMLHPTSAQIFKELTQAFFQENIPRNSSQKHNTRDYLDWIIDLN